MGMAAAPFAAFALSAVLGLAACDGDKATTTAPSATTTATTQPTGSATGTVAAGPRKLVVSNLMATNPGNLLLDPGFSQLSSQEASYGSFLSYYQDDNSTYTPDTVLDSRSPAGFSGNVAVLHAANATDKSSRGIGMLASVIGGTGPYHVSIWASRSNAAGAPVDLTLPDKNLTISLATNPDPVGGSTNTVYPLVGNPVPLKASNGRSWTHFTVDVSDPLPAGVFLLIGTGTKGGQYQLAAPEVTSLALTQQISTELPVRTTPRPQTESEAALLRRYVQTPRKFRGAEPRAGKPASE
jgi:hypothetical protein